MADIDLGDQPKKKTSKPSTKKSTAAKVADKSPTPKKVEEAPVAEDAVDSGVGGKFVAIGGGKRVRV